MRKCCGRGANTQILTMGVFYNVRDTAHDISPSNLAKAIYYMELGYRFNKLVSYI